ncbi:MAG: protein kinase [Candidatus Aminicenantes bacterium]|nr:protein kinase [Candidatus Aminicenantes bacterium]MDH5714291.1 protein kinase [Candidatus Aminicenantes bacterium]
MKCPKCHFDNPTDTRFCGKCGTQLPSSEEISASYTKTLQIPIRELTRGSTFAKRYEIIEELGRGGMGVVYKAEDTKLKRTVALKFLTPYALGSKEEKPRFVLEAQAAAALDHPHICTVYEIDEAEGQTFISMAYIDGQSLKEKIESGPLKLDEALNIAIQAAEGLQEAHEKGIVHRDIKSANIMVTERGKAKIMDFGLAKLAERTKITRTATIMGTVSYMSPEQAKGEAVDQRTDIWSLGVVLYEMIAGQMPFKGEYEQGAVYSILHETPPPLTGLRTGVPLELERIVNKCLEKEPSDRYQHADELIVDLRRLRKELKARAIPSRKVVSRETPRRRFKPLMVPGILFLAAVVIIAGYFFISRIMKTEFTKEQPVPPVPQRSIAVLPFVDMSPQGDQEYFCDGLAEELINALSKIEDLRVVARTSAFSFKGKELDIREIGKKLNVDTVLEGSVRKADNRLRIMAQLINVADGYHLWSDRFNREMEDIFAIQDEIAQAIVKALKIELMGERDRRLVKHYTENIEAYQFYQLGKHFERNYRNSYQEENFEDGVRMYNQAVEIDPNYALAYWGLANAYEAHFVRHKNKKDLDLMLKNYEIAYEIDPNLAEANVGLGWAYFYKEDLDRAYQSFKRALEIDPHSSSINYMVGSFLFSIGLYRQAIEYYSRSLERDPLYVRAYSLCARSYMYIGEFEQAALHLERALEIEPNDFRLHLDYARYFIMTKQYGEAEKALARAEEIKPGERSMQSYRAWLLAAKGEKDKALALIKDVVPSYHYEATSIYSLLGMRDEAIEGINEGIEKSFEYEQVYLYPYPFLINCPFYDNLRDDARFKEIVNKEKKKYEERLINYGKLLSIHNMIS